MPDALFFFSFFSSSFIFKTSLNSFFSLSFSVSVSLSFSLCSPFQILWFLLRVCSNSGEEASIISGFHRHGSFRCQPLFSAMHLRYYPSLSRCVPIFNSIAILLIPCSNLLADPVQHVPSYVFCLVVDRASHQIDFSFFSFSLYAIV